jgi:hypothetical protein
MSDVTNDLRGTMAPDEVKLSGTARVIGALLVALAIAAAGTYLYETSLTQHHTQVVQNDRLPQTSP